MLLHKKHIKYRGFFRPKYDNARGRSNRPPLPMHAAQRRARPTPACMSLAKPTTSKISQ
jgi:hypothetical protein